MVGAAGTAGAANGGAGGNGGDSWFGSSSTVIAKGGLGATSVTGASAVTTGHIGNQATFSGGAGGTGASHASQTRGGGGGGSSAGTGANGNSGSGNAASNGGAGGSAVTGGGPGGAGGNTGLPGETPASGPGGAGGGGGNRATTGNAAGAGFAGQVVVTYTEPEPTGDPIGSLTDDFNDNVRDVEKWDIGAVAFFDASVSVNETSGQLQITPLADWATAAISGYLSVQAYDLTNARMWVEVVQATGAGDAVTDVMLFVSGVTWLRARKFGDLLYWDYLINDVYQSPANASYSATTHRWWAIRHVSSDDTLRWETSEDGEVWTQRASVARPLPVTNLRVALSAGTFASLAAPGQAIFDHFNTTGAALPPSPVTRKALVGVGI